MCPPESVNRCRTSSRARTWATRCPPCFGRSIVGYPIRPMPLFRRRDERPSGSRPESASGRPDEDVDWRAVASLMATSVTAFFPNDQPAVFELLRVLKPGGRLAVSWWGAGDNEDELRKTWRGVIEEFAEHEVLQDAERRVIPWEERFSDPAVLKDVLHEAGLRDIWTERREYRFQMPREDWL